MAMRSAVNWHEKWYLSSRSFQWMSASCITSSEGIQQQIRIVYLHSRIIYISILNNFELLERSVCGTKCACINASCSRRLHRVIFFIQTVLTSGSGVMRMSLWNSYSDTCAISFVQCKPITHKQQHITCALNPILFLHLKRYCYLLQYLIWGSCTYHEDIEREDVCLDWCPLCLSTFEHRV